MSPCVVGSDCHRQSSRILLSHGFTRPLARSESREVFGAMASQKPSRQGRLFDPNSTRMNSPPRWSAIGEHGRASVEVRHIKGTHSTTSRQDMTWKTERLPHGGAKPGQGHRAQAGGPQEGVRPRGTANKGQLLDVIYADVQAQGSVRNSSTTSDATAVQSSEARKSQHYARPGPVSLHERSFKRQENHLRGGKLWLPWRGGLRRYDFTNEH